MEYLLLERKCPLCREIKNYIKIDLEINNNDDVCCICLEEYNNYICQCNNCKNIFHINCIQNINDTSTYNNMQRINLIIQTSDHTESYININIYNRINNCFYDCIYVIYYCIFIYCIFATIVYLMHILHLAY